MHKSILAVGAGLILAGFAYVLWTPTVEAPEDGTGTSTSTPQIQEVSLNENTDTYTIDGEYPQFGVPAMDAAVKSVVDQAVSAFKAYPANPPELAIPKNEQVISYSNVYTGADFISLSLVISEYTGGAHPNTVILGVTVDVSNGQELTLNGALELVGKSLIELAKEADTRLSAELGDAYFPEGATAKPENYSSFTVSQNKVTFIFNNYQVGPYAAGPQFVAFERVQ